MSLSFRSDTEPDPSTERWAASKMHRSLCCLALTYAVAAAGSTNETAPEVQRGLSKIGVEIAAEHCGAKAKRRKQQVKNPFDGAVIDHRETIQCANLVLVVYHANAHEPPNQILESLTLRGAHTKLPRQISPGATREEVLAYAGKPMQASRTSLVYLLNDEGPDQETATFEFSNGKLNAINWWWSRQ